tara:strand:- start:15 stop:161 length:147 start_codon:yes stop_codon:yes gene_type:complete
MIIFLNPYDVPKICGRDPFVRLLFTSDKLNLETIDPVKEELLITVLPD